MCKYLKQVYIDCVGVCNYYRWAEQLQLIYILLFFSIFCLCDFSYCLHIDCVGV